MAFNINVQGVKQMKVSHKWFNNTKADLEAILNEALLSCFYDQDLFYQDYLGISHQVQAIELGYTDF